jgi:hypothetical protein
MTAHLGAARLLVAKPALRQCHNAMRRAFGWFWRLYGAKLGVLVPLGAEPDTSTIWNAANDQGKLPAEVSAQLGAAKGYLFGSIKVAKFDELKFEKAAKLLEELCACLGKQT